MTYNFRPAVRENTPLIIGIAGPTKSGKTYSALRLATGLANGGTIAMINAEGLRGHQYADSFKYVTCDLAPPFRPLSYTESLKAAAALKPAVVIIDSVSHMHDGPGGILEWHEEILDRMAGQDRGKRDKCTFTAWVEPKASENQFIYAMLEMKCPVILSLRAKEKIKIVPGKSPLDLGWQPIVGERVAFETIFTLMLTPHCKGAPDLSLSDMREPFDTLIPKNGQLSEQTGQMLATWASGGTVKREDGVGHAGELIAPTRQESASNLSDAPAPKPAAPMTHADADREIAAQDAEQDWKTKLSSLKGTTHDVNALWKKIASDSRMTNDGRHRLYPLYKQAINNATP
jgi:AAA domain